MYNDDDIIAKELSILKQLICFILGILIGLVVYVVAYTIQSSNDIKCLHGHYTITYIKDNVTLKYYTNQIIFHDDQMISFRDSLSNNEIILNHYVIEVEDE